LFPEWIFKNKTKNYKILQIGNLGVSFFHYWWRGYELEWNNSG